MTEVLTLLKPHFQDTADKADPFASVLAIWAAKGAIRWETLSEYPTTKHALVMKDSELERGKLLCLRGRLVEIQVDRTAGPAIYIGGIMEGEKVVRFFAFGSTGELVAGNRANYCGIVTGRNSYSNSAGGVTHAVQTVGMFDLAENRAPVER